MGPETAATARPHPLRRATFTVRVALPVVTWFALLLSPLLVYPDRGPAIVGLLVAYILPPAGKESIMPLLIHQQDVSPFQAAMLIGGLDITTAWFLAWNWDLLTRVPLVERPIRRAMDLGRRWTKRYPALEGSAFGFIAIFVLVPAQGTGVIGGTVVGRLMGMPAQRTWVAVMIGTLASALAFAYTAEATGALIVHIGWEVVLAWTVIVMSMAALSVLVYRRFARA